MNLFGAFNQFIFTTYHRRFLAIRYSTYLQLLLPILAGWVWWQQWRWSNEFAMATLVLFLVLLVAYRIAHHMGYARFKRDKHAQMPVGDTPRMPAEKRLEIFATGLFANELRTDTVFLRPTKVWQMTHGDVGLMVMQSKKRYLYEFLLPDMIKKVESGHLLFGTKPLPSLAIHFGSTWGPKFAEHDRTYVAGTSQSLEPDSKLIYLTFEQPEQMPAVWRTLLDISEKQNG